MKFVGALSTVNNLVSHGHLEIGVGTEIPRSTVFLAEDTQGDTKKIVIGKRVHIGENVTIHGGTTIGDEVIIESSTIIGKPEHGMAVKRLYDGSGKDTTIGQRSIIRSHTVLYDGTIIGPRVHIGHYVLIRNDVAIGDDSQIGHYCSIERAVNIGKFVRTSPHTHITSSAVLEDRVFLGANVATVNDKKMIWKVRGREVLLDPPIFRYGAKVGSGSVVGSGVVVGRNALIGSGSVVTRSIPDNVIAYGNPAKVVGQ